MLLLDAWLSYRFFKKEFVGEKLGGVGSGENKEWEWLEGVG